VTASDVTCGAVAVTTPFILSSGFTFYVNGVKYQVKQWTFPDNTVKDVGTKTGLSAGTITCSGFITDQKGTTPFTALGVA
jgi:hypothetical protein